MKLTLNGHTLIAHIYFSLTVHLDLHVLQYLLNYGLDFDNENWISSGDGASFVNMYVLLNEMNMSGQAQAYVFKISISVSRIC